MSESELADLEQDVAALRMEIDVLQRRRADLEKKVENNNNIDQPADIEMQQFFSEFPQLYDVLNGKSNVKVLDQAGTAASDHQKNEKLDKDDNSMDITEDEWVLKMQPTVEHKLFDSSIARDINTEVLISPSKRRATLGISEPDDSVSNEKSELNGMIKLENMYRMFGITVFPVVDPSDLKLEKDSNEMKIVREMIGIRLEVFNESKGQIEKPHYILLKKQPKTNDWYVFKHTIPPFIDIDTLFLKVVTQSTGSMEDIYLFAKEVYLLFLHRNLVKRDLIQLESEGVISELQMDLNASMAKMNKFDNTLKMVLLFENQVVTSCKVITIPRDKAQEAKWQTILLGKISDLKSKLRSINNQNDKFYVAQNLEASSP